MLNFKKFLTFLVMMSPFCKEYAVAKNQTPLEIRQSTIGMRQKVSVLAMTRNRSIITRNALQLRAQPQVRRCLGVRSPVLLVKKGLMFPNRSVFARKPVLSRVLPQRRLFNPIPGRKSFGRSLFKRQSPVMPAPVPVSPVPSKVPQLPPAPPTHYTVKFKDFPVGYRAHVTRQCAIRRSPPPSPDSPVIIPHNSVKGKLEQCKTLDASYPGVSQALLTVLKAQGYKE